MESGCQGAALFHDKWKDADDASGLQADFAAFKAHVLGCGVCRSSYGPVLPLMEREFAPSSGSGADEAFVSRVMDAIQEPRGGSRGASPLSRVSFMVSAAAAAIVVTALLLAFAAPLLRPSDSVTVHFRLDAPAAASVTLVGSFTGWAASDGYRLRREGTGQWILTVRLKKNQLYSYGFLVDGAVWIPDPSAAEEIDDGFGGSNSVLRL